MPTKNIYFYFFIKKFYWPALVAERVQGGHGHGKKEMIASKKTEREKELFCATHTVLSYLRVAAGLARPATAAAATATAAATFIDWINLAAPPVTFSAAHFWRRLHNFFGFFPPALDPQRTLFIFGISNARNALITKQLDV